MATANTAMDLGDTTLTADSMLKSGSGAIDVASVTDGASSYTLSPQDDTPASTGAVTLPVEGIEEEVALLCCAEDAELFPHLLLLPGEVFILGDELQPALVAKSPPGLRFDLLFENDYPYVALLWRTPPTATDTAREPAPGKLVELARYNWDPWELAFSGPLCDQLPDPPGGLFELDLELSEALIPVGGVLPEPPEIETPVVDPNENQPTPY